MREKRFSVVFSPAAVRNVEGLEAAAAIQLIKDIRTYLEVRPIPIGKSRVKKLSGYAPPLCRIRSGDFRAYYGIRGPEVVILAVARRKEISITLPRKKLFKRLYQFKITLIGTAPPVWRRIQVPEYYTFYDLHVAIQDAMGWLDYHLHDFQINPRRRSCSGIRIECPFGIDLVEDEAPLLDTEVPLSDFLQEAGDRALYTYDYGDGWQHDVLFEGSYPKEPGKAYPICLAGELAGPPEDCGGIPGYYDCIKALKNRNNSEGRLEWLGSWRPDRFDPARIKFWSPLRRLKIALKG